MGKIRAYWLSLWAFHWYVRSAFHWYVRSASNNRSFMLVKNSWLSLTQLHNYQLTMHKKMEQCKKADCLLPPRDARVRLSYEKHSDEVSEPFMWAIMFFIATFTYTSQVSYGTQLHWWTNEKPHTSLSWVYKPGWPLSRPHEIPWLFQ